MIKESPGVVRILTMALFALSCFGLLLFLWLTFGGPVPLKPKGYRFDASFQEGSQLAEEADVRISGVNVGKVKTVTPNRRTGRADATIELDGKFAPLPSDSRAILRQKTLLGETYVELSPGSERRPKIPEGGRLANARVSPTVELDEIFRAFDPDTKRAFQEWMQSTARATDGRDRDISQAIGNLSGFSKDTTTLLQALDRQSQDVQTLTRNTGRTFAALSARQGSLSGLVRDGNRLFRLTAQQDRELQETFVALPTFQREAERTVRRLATFADDTRPLIRQLRPVARELTPTTQDLAALSPDLRALFRDIDPLVDASRRGLPAVRRTVALARPALRELEPTLRELNPIAEFLGLYQRETISFFANVAAATNASAAGAGGKQFKYLRTANPLGLENLAFFPNRLPTNRNNAYALPGAYDRLSQGIEQYETRQCRAGSSGGLVPLIANSVQDTPLLGPLLAQLPAAFPDNGLGTLQEALGAATNVPCRQQGQFDINGKRSQFPQVSADEASSARRRAKRSR